MVLLLLVPLISILPQVLSFNIFNLQPLLWLVFFTSIPEIQPYCSVFRSHFLEATLTKFIDLWSADNITYALKI